MVGYGEGIVVPQENAVTKKVLASLLVGFQGHC